MSEVRDTPTDSIQNIDHESLEIVTPQKPPNIEEVEEQESEDENHLNEYVGSDDESSSFISTADVSIDVSTTTKTYKKKHTISFSDNITRRVLAPYVRGIRKRQKVVKQKEEEKEQFEDYLKRKPSVLLRDLSKFLGDRDVMSILFQTAEVLKEVVRAVGVTLYLVDEAAGEIFQSPRYVQSERQRVAWKIEQGKTVAAYVASTKDYVITDDVLGDLRFLDGVAYQDETIKSVLCVPIVNPDNKCIGIFELYRDVYQPNFCNDDLKTAVVITSWVGIAVYENEKRLALQQQRELNDYLLELILRYFGQKAASIEKLISEIVTCAKDTVGAEKGSFYIVYEERREFEAEAFEEDIDEDSKLHRKTYKVKLEPNSILGVVAETLEIVNIRDAYADPRYDAEADVKIGVITRSLLCVPITSVKGILGLIQLTNKKKSVCFSKSDENLLKQISLYCAIALQYYHRSVSLFQMGKRNECSEQLFRYHSQPCCHDLKYYTDDHVFELPENFDELTWHLRSDTYMHMPELIMNMMVRIIGADEIERIAMMQFILSVRKVYQDNHYHTFEHAFTVSHCMYAILLRNQIGFTIIELKSLMIAVLCHDLDHRGFSNQFLHATNNVLAQLYEESFLENHHFQMTLLLLQDCKMFKTMTCYMFQEILCEIRELILATDLIAHFKCRTKLSEILKETKFDIKDSVQRRLLKNIMMTMCDLSGQCKPYSYVKKRTDSLYQEFYREGDLSKKMGLVLLSLMDRDRAHLVPEDQVQFQTIVVIPCAELLTSIFPNIESLLIEAKKIRDAWTEIIELREERCWAPKLPSAD